MPSFIKSYSQNKKKRKKLFIGYSDGTALHLYLNGQKQSTLHAPMISELPELSTAELLRLKNLLFGETKQTVFQNLKTLLKFPQQKIKAPILGGNLSLLSSSMGSPWFPKLSSHFLFVEDIHEEAYKVDRLLHHLWHSGSLKGVKALLFGAFPPLSNPALKGKVLKSFSEVCPLPMIFGLPCGHTKAHYPLFFQKPAELCLQGEKAYLKIQN